MSTGNQTTKKPEVKMYVLSDHLKPNANVYQQVSENQKVKVAARPIDHAYLQVTYTNKEGKQETSRLKLMSNTINQEEQIKAGIPANEKFTPQEKKAVEFRNGVLMASKPIVQKFLDEHPQNEAFEGQSEFRPMFKLYDTKQKLKSVTDDINRRLDAGLKVRNMSEAERAELMILLNGSFFQVPDEPLEVFEQLIGFINDADDAMLDKILSTEITLDEKIMLTMGKAINLNILSFDEIPDQVAKRSGNNWVPVKQVSSALPPQERQSAFIEYLGSSDGKAFYEALQSQVEKESGEGGQSVKTKAPKKKEEQLS